MITVTITHDKITLSGHADYAPKGYDIVCEAMGALTQTFAASLPEWRTVCMESGNVEFDTSNLTHDEQVMLTSYKTGIDLLASAYPANVHIINNN